MAIPSWLYDLLMAPLDRLGLDRYRARLTEGMEGRVLEIGAGTGRNGRHFQAPAVALDRDLRHLERARACGLRADLVCADARALPFKDGAFDQAIESLVFCSLPEPERCLSELRRVVKPGGELRMIDHVLAGGALGKLQRALAPAWLWATGDCHLDRDVKALVERSGAQIERLETRHAGLIQETVIRA